MSLKVYTLEQRDEWDKIVKSFKQYDVYYLSGYVKGFYLHGDGMPLLFFYDSNNCRGINVVMKRDVAKDPLFEGRIEPNSIFDLITPYGYGGWIIEGDFEESSLFFSYEKWCRDHQIVSEFVRYHPILNNQFYSQDFYDVTSIGNTVMMDLKSPELIWKNIASKNRNMIRKAQKNGIKVYNGRYPQIFEEFREIYNKTMDKDNASQYYYFNKDFYDSTMNDLENETQIFYAMLDNKIIAASIILSSNKKINYHLSGSLREFQSLAPTNLILYKVALWGCENGYKTFHLGGGVGSSQDSLFKFKKVFNRNAPLEFCIGKKIFDLGIYNDLLNIRGLDQTSDTNFFPSYRA